MWTSTPKTLEFSMPVATPEHWFDTATKVWNQAIFYLRWLQHYKRVIQCNALDLPPVEIKIRKTGDDWVLYCDRQFRRRIDKTKSWDDDNIEWVDCWQTASEWLTNPPSEPEKIERKGSNLVNPLWVTEPPIKDYSAISLRKPFTQKACPWIKESGMPAVLVNDFIGLVVVPAWEAYQKGQRGKPRYKHEDDRIDTLPSESFRGQCRLLGGDGLKLPVIGKITLYQLESRLLIPMQKMIQDMRSNPENYPRLQAKIDKFIVLERAKLIKADGHDLKQLRKELSEEDLSEFFRAYESQIDKTALFEKAIEYFSLPGAFRLIRRNGKHYIQISAEMPVKVRGAVKTVAIDTGTALLIDSSNKLTVPHQDFSKELERIKQLQRKLSDKEKGSRNWHKLNNKINNIKSRVKHSRRAFQHYWAQQIVSVNKEIFVKEINFEKVIDVPVPVPDGDGQYLPNGRGETKDNNRQIMDAAIGQFVALIESKAKPALRKVEKIKVDESANSHDMISSVNNSSFSAAATLAPSQETDAGESLSGKGKPTANIQLLQASNFVSPANTPKERKRPRRNRQRERKIG